MIQIFRITTSPNAPRLSLRSPTQYDDRFMIFDGSGKAAYSPRATFDVVEEPCLNVRQFYLFAPGVLVCDWEAMSQCDHMYYAAEGTERLAMRGMHKSFSAINSLDALPKPASGTSPCIVDQFNASIFRIEGAPATDVYCVSGFEIPMDEFKNVYDAYGFSGLIFEEVWSGERGPPHRWTAK